MQYKYVFFVFEITAFQASFPAKEDLFCFMSGEFLLGRILFPPLVENTQSCRIDRNEKGRFVPGRKDSVANRTIFVEENLSSPLESNAAISYNYIKNQGKERNYEPDSVSDNRQ